MIHREKLSERIDALHSAQLSLEEYLDVLRERVTEVEPQIGALVSEPDRWGRIQQRAETLRQTCSASNDAPRLYGVPVGIKDIFHVDGLPTKAGSKLPPAALSGRQSPVVTRLQAAGAIVLGKTVTAEFAYFDPGPTRNPHNREHTPGGSSSGSAAAVAAGLCPLAIGSQTVGSVIRPAAFCGIVGYKPSDGRLSTEGMLPFSPSVDHVGYFTQDVEGIERVGPVLCEEWASVDPDSRPTLGIPEGPYLEQASGEGYERFTEQTQVLETAGYEIQRVSMLDSIGAVNERHERLTHAEAALVHDNWYDEYGDRYSETMAEIVEAGREVTVEELAAARSSRAELRDSIETTMQESGVDILLSPAAPGPAPSGIDDTGDPVMNLPWTHAGVPAITVPAGTADNGLPLGMQCVAPVMKDEYLVACANGVAEALANGPQRNSSGLQDS